MGKSSTKKLLGAVQVEALSEQIDESLKKNNKATKKQANQKKNVLLNPPFTGDTASENEKPMKKSKQAQKAVTKKETCKLSVSTKSDSSSTSLSSEDEQPATKTKNQPKNLKTVVQKPHTPEPMEDDSTSTSEDEPLTTLLTQKKSTVASKASATKKNKKFPAAVPESSSSSSTSSSDDELPQQSKPPVVTKKVSQMIPSSMTKKTVAPSSSESSSDDDTSSEDEETNLGIKAAPEKALAGTKNCEINNSTTESESDNDSETNSSSDSEVEQPTKLASVRNKKPQTALAVKTGQSAKTRVKDDSSSSEEEDSNDEETEKPMTKQGESTDSESSSDEEDDEDGHTAEDSTKLLSSLQLDGIVASYTRDASILKAWKCSLNLETASCLPELVEIYSKQNSNVSVVDTVSFDIEVITKNKSGPLSILKLVQGDSSANQHHDHNIRGDSKKRSRISLDGGAQPAKRQFQDNDQKPEIFVGNLPYGTTEEELRNLFEESCGKVQRIKLLSQGGAAFIEFESAEAVNSALEWNRSDYNGRKLNINLASDKPNKSMAPGSNKPRGSFFDSPPNSTVIVRNIPYNTQPDSLKSFFGECGQVTHVNLPTFQDTGKLRGFAIVHFSNPTEANSALNLSGQQFSGRSLTIEIAHNREPNGFGNTSGGNGGNRAGFQRRPGNNFARPRKPFEKSGANATKLNSAPNSHQVFNDADDE